MMIVCLTCDSTCKKIIKETTRKKETKKIEKVNNEKIQTEKNGKVKD